MISSRLDTDDRDDTDPNTEESPIIDVPEEPHPPEHEWAPQVVPGGAHRRPSEVDPASSGWQPQPTPEPPRAPEPAVQSPWLMPEPPPRATPPPPPPPPPPPQPQQPWQEPEPARRHSVGGEPQWRPAPAEGEFIPAGNPGSNWLSDVSENGSSAHPAPATPEPQAPPPTHEPAMTPPPAEVPRGRHSTAGSTEAEPPRRARHSAPADVDPGRRQPAPTLAPPPAPQPPPPPPSPSESERAARHRGLEELEPDDGQHAGGQPLSELLARLQVGSTGGGRRRRREE